MIKIHYNFKTIDSYKPFFEELLKSKNINNKRKIKNLFYRGSKTIMKDIKKLDNFLHYKYENYIMNKIFKNFICKDETTKKYFARNMFRIYPNSDVLDIISIYMNEEIYCSILYNLPDKYKRKYFYSVLEVYIEIYKELVKREVIYNYEKLYYKRALRKILNNKNISIFKRLIPEENDNKVKLIISKKLKYILNYWDIVEIFI